MHSGRTRLSFLAVAATAVCGFGTAHTAILSRLMGMNRDLAVLTGIVTACFGAVLVWFCFRMSERLEQALLRWVVGVPVAAFHAGVLVLTVGGDYSSRGVTTSLGLSALFALPIGTLIGVAALLPLWFAWDRSRRVEKGLAAVVSVSALWVAAAGSLALLLEAATFEWQLRHHPWTERLTWFVPAVGLTIGLGAGLIHILYGERAPRRITTPTTVRAHRSGLALATFSAASLVMVHLAVLSDSGALTALGGAFVTVLPWAVFRRNTGPDRAVIEWLIGAPIVGGLIAVSYTVRRTSPHLSYIQGFLWAVLGGIALAFIAALVCAWVLRRAHRTAGETARDSMVELFWACGLWLVVTGVICAGIENLLGAADRPRELVLVWGVPVAGALAMATARWVQRNRSSWLHRVQQGNVPGYSLQALDAELTADVPRFFLRDKTSTHMIVHEERGAPYRTGTGVPWALVGSRTTRN